jgi:hypothetical protein
MDLELRMRLNRAKTVGEMRNGLFLSTLIIRAQESVSRGVLHAEPGQRSSNISQVNSPGQNRDKRMEPISNGPHRQSVRCLRVSPHPVIGARTVEAPREASASA